MGAGDLEEEAKAFDDNDSRLASDKDEKGSSTFGGAIRTVSISYALTPVATSTRDVLSISAAVNLSSILVEGLRIMEREIYIRTKAQTGERFMISKLGI